MKAPLSYLLAVILAVVDLAYTRRRLRSHVDAVHGPRIWSRRAPGSSRTSQMPPRSTRCR